MKICVYANRCAEFHSEGERTEAEDREVKRYLQTAVQRIAIDRLRADRAVRLKLQNIY